MNTSNQPARGITLIEAAKGEAFPAAPSSSAVLSSLTFGWRGIIVEQHCLAPQELPEHYETAITSCDCTV